MNVILFTIGDGLFGIDMARVLKIDKYVEESLQSIPLATPPVLGSINYQERPICTFDLDLYFVQDASVNKKAVVVFIGDSELLPVGALKINFLKGNISGVNEADIRKVAGEQKGIKNFVTGMVNTSEGEVSIIDIDCMVETLRS